MNRRMLFPMALAWLIAACAAPPSASGPSGQAPANQPTARTLVAAIRVEPKTIAARGLGQNTGVALYLTKKMFNADLALLDDQANPLPYLAEALPQLNSDTWKVASDGTMETTYRLKPNLVWHDGTPLTTDDFVFSWKAYATPELGSAASPPISLIKDAQAPDARTLVIHWTQPYAEAGSLQSVATGATGLPPLPGALLGPALESGSADAVLNHPFWSAGFVGLGPYKLSHWEPGAFIEAAAFDRHALGAPKIQRIKMLFMPDGNSSLAAMLAGEVHFTADNGMPPPQAATLLQQWPPGAASVVQYANQWRAVHFQFRPDFVNPAYLKDGRVRKALAYAADKASVNGLVYDGQYPLAEIFFSPTSELGRAVDAAITKYRFDLRQTEQIMAEVGFTKGSDGTYVSTTAGRFSAELRTNGGPDNEAEMSALASVWRSAGFDIREWVLPAVQAQDNQVRSSFTGTYIHSTNVGAGQVANMLSNNIPRPENQWRGASYDGYATPEMDRLVSAFTTALAPADRIRAAVDIARLYNSDLPAISLFYPTQPWVFTSDLTGPKLVAAESNVAWDIHLWQFR